MASPTDPTDNTDEGLESKATGRQGRLQGVVLLLGDAWFGRTLCSPHPCEAGAPPGPLSKAMFPLLCPEPTAPTSCLDPNPGVQIILEGTLQFLSFLPLFILYKFLKIFTYF